RASLAWTRGTPKTPAIPHMALVRRTSVRRARPNPKVQVGIENCAGVTFPSELRRLPHPLVARRGLWIPIKNPPDPRGPRLDVSCRTVQRRRASHFPQNGQVARNDRRTTCQTFNDRKSKPLRIAREQNGTCTAIDCGKDRTRQLRRLNQP